MGVGLTSIRYFTLPYLEVDKILTRARVESSWPSKAPFLYSIFLLVVVLEYNSHFLVLSSLRRKTSPVQENHCNLLCFKGTNFGWASEVSSCLEQSRVLRGKERSTLYLTVHLFMLSKTSPSWVGFINEGQGCLRDAWEWAVPSPLGPSWGGP